MVRKGPFSVRILHAIHDFLPRHRAGSELYALRLCHALRGRGHEVAVVCAEYDGARKHGSSVRREVEGVRVFEVANNWAFGRFAESYGSESVGAALERTLDAERPDVVHLHSTLNLTLDLPQRARRRRIPTVATLHDFTLVCPSGGQRVHLREEHVCESLDTTRCARCFGESPFQAQMAAAASRRWWSRAAPTPPSEADIEQRLAAVRTMASAVSRFVAPSAALAADMIRFGLPQDRVTVSDYGFPPWPAAAAPRPRGPRLVAGFVGTLAWHKGVHVLLEALHLLPADAVEAVIFGDLDTFPDYTARLRALAKGRHVTFGGGFDAKDAPAAYAAMDVLVVPSLWPENSPLVVHEAFQAGVPVVAARSGGLPERVREGVDGLLYAADRPDALAACLARLTREPSLLHELGRGSAPVKTIARDAEEWEGVYASALAEERGAARA